MTGPKPPTPKPEPPAVQAVTCSVQLSCPPHHLESGRHLARAHPPPQAGTPPPPFLYTLPYFLSFLGCWWLLEVADVCRGGGREDGCLKFGFLPPRRKLLVGLPPSLRSVAFRDCGCRWAVCGLLLSLRHSKYPPVGDPASYQLPDLVDVHSFFLLFQLHPMADSRNRFLVCVHLDAWVMKPFQVTFPSLPAERAYCGP